jgi:hypothetical protein
VFLISGENFIDDAFFQQTQVSKEAEERIE